MGKQKMQFSRTKEENFRECYDPDPATVNEMKLTIFLPGEKSLACLVDFSSRRECSWAQKSKKSLLRLSFGEGLTNCI